MSEMARDIFPGKKKQAPYPPSASLKLEVRAPIVIVQKPEDILLGSARHYDSRIREMLVLGYGPMNKRIIGGTTVGHLQKCLADLATVCARSDREARLSGLSNASALQNFTDAVATMQKLIVKECQMLVCIRSVLAAPENASALTDSNAVESV